MDIKTIVYVVLAIVIALFLLKITRKLIHLTVFAVVAAVAFFVLRAVIGW